MPLSFPDPLSYEVMGIETRPHDDHRRRGYLVRIKSLHVWMPVEDALRNGVVPIPPPLPGASPSQPVDHAEVQARLTQLRKPTLSTTF